MGLFSDGTKFRHKEVEKAKIVGVRTAEQTKIMATYNFGIYSVLVKFVDGSVELAEVKYDSPEMKTLVNFMDV